MQLRLLDPSKFDLVLSSKQDAMAWALNGADWVSVQLFWGIGTAWPASAVVTAEVSQDGINWRPIPAGAVTFTDITTDHDRIRVSGFAFFRLRVSTDAAGSQTVVPTVSGSVDP